MTNSRSKLSGSESDKKQKDVAGIVADLGRQFKKIFTKKQKPNDAEQSPNDSSFTGLLKKDPGETSHGTFTFAAIYANDPAQAVIREKLVNFPPGSIIVREKLETATSEAPQSVIAMVKREPGFSKATDDWEFFAFEAKDMRLKSRETKGDCAKCHIEAQAVDWVFRDYLK